MNLATLAADSTLSNDRLNHFAECNKPVLSELAIAVIHERQGLHPLGQCISCDLKLVNAVLAGGLTAAVMRPMVATVQFP